MLARPFAVLLLLSAFVFTPSAQAQNEVLARQEASAVKNAVSAFYRAAQGGRNFRKMDTRLVSEELNALFQLAKAVEKRSAREISASDHPADKPLLLEGAVLTPYYEGYNKVLVIENIRKMGSAYRADVKLTYDLEQPQFVWTDTTVVVREDGRWRVDDVLFQQNETGAGGSVKGTLRDFAGVGNRVCSQY
ncbi:MAG: hypothetical protein LBL48_02325 [Azoarcus sp.]|jgi:hypothetical protein|nr:hypothetical protein [Azoarcus sp.]